MALKSVFKKVPLLSITCLTDALAIMLVGNVTTRARSHTDGTALLSGMVYSVDMSCPSTWVGSSVIWFAYRRGKSREPAHCYGTIQKYHDHSRGPCGTGTWDCHSGVVWESLGISEIAQADKIVIVSDQGLGSERSVSQITERCTFVMSSDPFVLCSL